MKPTETYWTLDSDEHIEIARRGFPLVPNFSTTIDGATGHTLKTSITDLGDFGNVPSYHAAMRGYIALSRVTSADNMLLARSFNPMLFRLGPQPFPSLLFRALGEFDDNSICTTLLDNGESHEKQASYQGCFLEMFGMPKRTSMDCILR